jgi:hypothetical protein
VTKIGFGQEGNRDKGIKEERGGAKGDRILGEGKWEGEGR